MASSPVLNVSQDQSYFFQLKEDLFGGVEKKPDLILFSSFCLVALKDCDCSLPSTMLKTS